MMSTLIAKSSLVAALMCLPTTDASSYVFSAEQQFGSFKSTYNRVYKSKAEEEKRRECFSKNLETIESLRKSDPTAAYGLNHFADVCPEEFKVMHNLKVQPKRNAEVSPLLSGEVELGAVDWRKHGAVTGVKNQGQCGSCWAFSAIGNIEGQHFLAGNKLVSLSEEELVQCSRNGGNAGCNGGLMDNAFDWVVSNGGIDSEADYPYTSGGGVTGTCNNAKLGNVAANITGHVDIAQDENQMALWVSKNGPLSVAVDAGVGWQLYFGGVKTSCEAGQLDHGVLIVGYGSTADGVKYWTIKNSWGPSWGEEGYIRLKRGVNCNGVRESASSSLIKK